MRTEQGHEVDFLAVASDGGAHLVQAAEDVGNASTFERELRSLLEAGAEYRGARKTLIVNRPVPRGVEAPKGVDVVALWRWLLAPTVT